MTSPEPVRSGDSVTVDKDMSISHQDFFRVLPGALASDNYRVDGDRVVVEEGDCRRLEITLSPEGRRDVPDLSLPKTQVRLTFTGFTEAEMKDRLALFERSFQRGGG